MEVVDWKGFQTDCGDVLFNQFTMDCNPAEDSGFDLVWAKDGSSVSAVYKTIIPTTTAERLRMCNWQNQQDNFIVKCVEREIEAQNRHLFLWNHIQ